MIRVGRKGKKGGKSRKGVKAFKTKLWVSIFTTFFILLLLSSNYSFAQSIYFQSDSTSNNFGKIIVTEVISEDQSDRLKVYLESEWKLRGENGIAILGNTTIKPKLLIFSPLLPFQHKQNYVATYPGLVPLFFTPNYNKENTYLKNIYPSADTLPTNLLKFYLKFSSPMSVGNIHDYIFLKDELGNTVPYAFLEMQTELWDSTQQGLTIWLDPGRIKRDLKPNLSLGQPLVPGQHYTLFISKNWKNAQGVPLQNNYTKAFYVTREDRQKPAISDWNCIPPSKQTLEPLSIKSLEPLDFGSSIHAVTILHNNEVIAGTWASLPKEKGWQFTPIKPWKSGPYHCLFKPTLEDLAGNNLDRLFDQPTPNQSNEQQSHQLLFLVK